MSPLLPQADLIFLLIFAILAIAIVFTLSNNRHRNVKREDLNRTNNTDLDTEKLPQAIFVDLSPKSADVVELAVEVWRINNRLMKIGDDLTDLQKRGLESSIQKFVKFLDHYFIKIVDHSGEKYNEGMNIEVLSFEKDPTLKSPIIKETIEPTITCNDHVIKKGKVIVVTN